MGLDVKEFIYILYVHINLIKMQKKSHKLCHYKEWTHFIAEIPSRNLNWQTAPASKGSGSHTHTHTLQRAACYLAKVAMKFLHSQQILPLLDQTRWGEFPTFLCCCWVLCQVEAHRSLSPERVFPNDTPHTHTPPPSLPHTTSLLLHATNPSLYYHILHLQSAGKRHECVCDCIQCVCMCGTAAQLALSHRHHVQTHIIQISDVLWGHLSTSVSFYPQTSTYCLSNEVPAGLRSWTLCWKPLPTFV